MQAPHRRGTQACSVDGCSADPSLLPPLPLLTSGSIPRQLGRLMNVRILRFDENKLGGEWRKTLITYNKRCGPRVYGLPWVHIHLLRCTSSNPPLSHQWRQSVQLPVGRLGSLRLLCKTGSESKRKARYRQGGRNPSIHPSFVETKLDPSWSRSCASKLSTTP